MQNVRSEEALSELLQSSPAVLLLYGGASCGVCQAIKPRLAPTAQHPPTFQVSGCQCLESGYLEVMKVRRA